MREEDEDIRVRAETQQTGAKAKAQKGRRRLSPEFHDGRGSTDRGQARR